jgi:gliding motility-associated protein GldM
MASGKLPPRQKMINMMYLVLTALLALNVSKDILKAFHMVEVSMMKSGKNIDDKNNMTMKALEKEMSINAEKTRPFYEKAQQARKVSKELTDYLDNIKTMLVKQAEGRKDDEDNHALPEAERELAQPDNIEKHAFHFIKKDGGAESKKLKEKINSTREALLKLLSPAEQKDVKTDLYTPDPPSHGGQKQAWESEMFEHAPLAAVVTMIEKIKNDCKNTESQVLDLLAKGINKDDIKFDQTIAVAVPTKGTVIPIGGEFEAEIYLAAYDSKKNNEMFVNGRAIDVKDGKGLFKTNPSSEGEQKLKVVVNVRKPDGSVEEKTAELAYTAFKGMATISAEKMNVVYIGLDNPIAISVPGSAPEQIIANCVGGRMIPVSGQKGHWNLQVDGGKEVEIIASVRSKDGTVKRVESKKYRVKKVPSPTPMVGKIINSSATPSEIKGLPYVVCDLADFAFEGIRYKVLSFDAILTRKGGDPIIANGVQGQTLPGNIVNGVSGARAGDMLIISNIKADAIGTKIGVVNIKSSILLKIK